MVGGKKRNLAPWSGDLPPCAPPPVYFVNQPHCPPRPYQNHPRLTFAVSDEGEGGGEEAEGGVGSDGEDREEGKREKQREERNEDE